MEDSGRREGGVGPIVGLVIILIVIILGGLYFWGERAKNTAPAPNQAASASATSTTSDAELNALQTQGTSTDVNSIQSDLNNTNVDSVDQSVQ